MEALQAEIKPGLGRYAVVKVWEIELMIDLGITDEAQYARIPVRTRARMIAARKTPGMIDRLNQNREYLKLRRDYEQQPDN